MQLALKLVHERRLGAASRLAPYVAALPQAYSTPLSWGEAGLAALQYPHLQQQVPPKGLGACAGPFQREELAGCHQHVRAASWVQMRVRLATHHRVPRSQDHLGIGQSMSGSHALGSWHLMRCCVHGQVRLQKQAMEAMMAGLRKSTPSTPVTEADLGWALQAVRSRSFSGPYAGAARGACPSEGTFRESLGFTDCDACCMYLGGACSGTAWGPASMQGAVPCAGPQWQSRAKTIGAVGLLAGASVVFVHVPMEQAWCSSPFCRASLLPV